MAVSRFVNPLKRQYVLWAKLTAVGVLGLCFIVMGSLFSSSSSSVTSRRESFGDINEPVVEGDATRTSGRGSSGYSPKEEDTEKREDIGKDAERDRFESVVDSLDEKAREVNETRGLAGDDGHGSTKGGKENVGGEGKEISDSEVDRRGSGGKGGKIGNQKEGEENGKDGGEEDGDEELILDGEGEGLDQEVQSEEERERDPDSGESVDGENTGNEEEEALRRPKGAVNKGKKGKGPMFDPKAHYSWILCNTRSKHNYIPCIDNEGGVGKSQIYRHSERSCPRMTPMCLVPLPHGGYETPVQWPDSKSKYSTKMWHTQNLLPTLANTAG